MPEAEVVVVDAGAWADAEGAPRAAALAAQERLAPVLRLVPAGVPLV